MSRNVLLLRAPIAVLACVIALAGLWAQPSLATECDVSELEATLIGDRDVRSASNSPDRADQASGQESVVPTAGVRGVVAPLLDRTTGGPVGEAAWVSSRRGRGAFLIVNNGPEAGVDIALGLAARQVAMAPDPGNREPGPIDDVDSPPRAVGRTLGMIVFYLLFINGVARGRDRLAGPLFRRRFQRPNLSGSSLVVDVSAAARRRKRRGWVGFPLQVVGLSLLAGGALTAMWGEGYGLAMAGLVIGVVLPWCWDLLSGRRLRNRSRIGGILPLTNRRRARTALASAAAALVLLVAWVVAIGANLLSSPSGRSRSPANDAGSIGPVSSLLAMGVLAMLLFGAAGLARLARRYRALDARAVIDQDNRPIVLYLRSFTDDNLTIRAMVTGRHSLVEKLSPSRFVRFEEAVVSQLNQRGPVVAANMPGTDLAPIGAAKANLTEEDWRSTIVGWMEQAVVIVIAVPPEEPMPGLRWELEQIGNRDLWDKTLLLLPPLHPYDLRRRWSKLAPLLTELTGAPALPDPAYVLVAAVRRGALWPLVVADERTEWTYTEALLESIKLSPTPA